ncbi:hypothetical protein V5O48_008140 [Marasmius crinis-equi]|uniref:Uncharacterized protein n=1 Tax=Marasmius crinis-equi TaxID=585013 RepID=A0ABR3FF59_9AGAR
MASNTNNNSANSNPETGEPAHAILHNFNQQSVAHLLTDISLSYTTSCQYTRQVILSTHLQHASKFNRSLAHALGQSSEDNVNVGEGTKCDWVAKAVDKSSDKRTK